MTEVRCRQQGCPADDSGGGTATPVALPLPRCMASKRMRLIVRQKSMLASAKSDASKSEPLADLVARPRLPGALRRAAILAAAAAGSALSGSGGMQLMLTAWWSSATARRRAANAAPTRRAKRAGSSAAKQMKRRGLAAVPKCSPRLGGAGAAPPGLPDPEAGTGVPMP